MFRYVAKTPVLKGRKAEPESHSGVRSLREGLGAISSEPENGSNHNLGCALFGYDGKDPTTSFMKGVRQSYRTEEAVDYQVCSLFPKRGAHALDHMFDSLNFVASWIGERPYDGWSYSCPAGHRHHRLSGPAYSGTKSAVTIWAFAGEACGKEVVSGSWRSLRVVRHL